MTASSKEVRNAMQVKIGLANVVAQSAVAILKSGSHSNALSYAEGRGDAHVAMFLKATVPPGTTSNMDALVPVRISNDFVASVSRQSLPGRMAGIRKSGFEEATPAVLGTGTSAWIGEGAQIPVTRFSLEAVPLRPATVASISVFSREVMRASNVEEIVDTEIRATDARAVDLAFIDPSNDGVPNIKPASITFGAPSVNSTGDPSVDIAALFGAFEGDASTAYFITHPNVAVRLALHRDAGGAYVFPDAGPRGGSVLGIPLLTSTAVPSDGEGAIFVIADAAAIVLADGGVALDESTQADVAMLDNPNGPSQMVSLWQTNCGAVRLLHDINFRVARPGSVAYISGVSW